LRRGALPSTIVFVRRALSSLVIAAGLTRPAGTALGEGQNAEGEYGGVQPGEGKKPDSKKAKKPPPKGTLSWIGFDTKDGGSQVFFQSVAAFEVSQRIDKGTVVVTLSGLTKLGHNTWRPIDTRFFETPIARITAKKKGKSVEVRVAFKNGKQAAQGSVRTATEADGMYYAYVTFAGGGSSSDAPTTKEPEK
jgi:hypothetical protein